MALWAFIGTRHPVPDAVMMISMQTGMIIGSANRVPQFVACSANEASIVVVVGSIKS